jgi:hypothetical protein
VGNQQSYTLELGTGLTPWWHSELELGFFNNPSAGQPTALTAVVTENMFQLTEPGEQFADFGFYIEYGQSTMHGSAPVANEVTLGPVIAKQIGRFTHTVNLFVTQELGPNQTNPGFNPDFNFAWQSRWNLSAFLSPAIEVYGDPGPLGKMPGFSQQQLIGGPVAVGNVHLNDIGLGHAGQIKYEVGWLFGLTSASPTGTLRWRLELEIPF